MLTSDFGVSSEVSCGSQPSNGQSLFFLFLPEAKCHRFTTDQIYGFLTGSPRDFHGLSQCGCCLFLRFHLWVNDAGHGFRLNAKAGAGQVL